MDLMVGGGFPLISLTISLVDIGIIIWLAWMSTRKWSVPGHVLIAKMTLFLYATLGVVSAVGAIIAQQPTDLGMLFFLTSVIALSIRLGVLVMLIAWVWLVLESRPRLHIKFGTQSNHR